MSSIKYLLCGLLLTLLLGACNSDDQALPDQDKAFVKYYGSSGDQRAAALVSDGSNGYLLLGDATNSDNKRQLYWARVDRTGELINEGTYSEPTGDLQSVCLKARPDGGFLIGAKLVLPNGDHRPFVMALSETAQAVTPPVILQANGTGNYVLQDITEASDGWIITGWTDQVDITKPQFNAATDNRDLYAAKVTSSGQIRWELVYGFPSADEGLRVAAAGTNTIVLGTTTTATPFIRQAPWAVRLNNNEAILEQYAFPFEQQSLRLEAVVPLSNGNFELIGAIGNGNYQRFTLNSALQRSSDFSAFSLPESEGIDEALFRDNQLALVYRERLSLDDSALSFALLDENNSTRWQRRFGGNGEDSPAGLLLLNDGYVLLGSVNLVVNQMIALIRTNKEGLLTP
jgi:hypothetical protein